MSHEPRGELAFIQRLAAILGSGVAAAKGPITAVPFGDDMCVIAGGDPPTLGTVDMLMDGVHFDSRTQSWDLIGRKAMAVNLSDCAAMAVVPVSAMCAVCLAENLTMDDALTLWGGAHAMGLRYGCPIVGGDTNSWAGPTVISISVAARCEVRFSAVTRAGARPGDAICLTGPVGGSSLGRHLTFEPRVREALAIRRRITPHAMIDISDGLALDLHRILTASGCGAELDGPAIDQMTHPDARTLADADGRSAREHALGDGEDFELIVVVAPDDLKTAREEFALRPIGTMSRSPGVVLIDADGRRTPVGPLGWEHFR